jgi:hypothetical protein
MNFIRIYVSILCWLTLTHASSVDGLDYTTVLGRGKSYTAEAEKGNWEANLSQAYQHFEHLTRMNPNRPAGWYHMANVILMIGIAEDGNMRKLKTCQYNLGLLDLNRLQDIDTRIKGTPAIRDALYPPSTWPRKVEMAAGFILYLGASDVMLTGLYWVAQDLGYTALGPAGALGTQAVIETAMQMHPSLALLKTPTTFFMAYSSSRLGRLLLESVL